MPLGYFAQQYAAGAYSLNDITLAAAELYPDSKGPFGSPQEIAARMEAMHASSVREDFAEEAPAAFNQSRVIKTIAQYADGDVQRELEPDNCR